MREEIQDADQDKYDEVRIDRNGQVIGGEAPEKMSQKEYNIARMMSKLDKEERVRLR